MYSQTELTELRKKAVRELTQAEDKGMYVRNNAETLFSLDLTMYTQNHTLNSLFFNAISYSLSCSSGNSSSMCM